MTDIIGAFTWLGLVAHWAGPTGVWVRVGEHALYSVMTLVCALLIALPLGFLIGHTGKFVSLAVGLSGLLRALPTLGLVIYFALVMVNITIVPPLIALTILAIPPILAGTYSGIAAVDRSSVDAARAMGMTPWQVLGRVELPLAFPLIMGGIRSAALQVIATWTVAAILPVGGLGRYLFDGLAVQNYAEMLAGSLVVVAMALIVDGLFALAQRVFTPRGVRHASSRTHRRVLMRNTSSLLRPQS